MTNTTMESVFVLAGMAFAMILGMVIGYIAGADKLKNAAVDQGLAEYRADNRGNVSWLWITEVEGDVSQ